MSHSRLFPQRPLLLSSLGEELPAPFAVVQALPCPWGSDHKAQVKSESSKGLALGEYV